MERIFFEVAYKGTNYHGWQRQKNAMSVQQVIEESLSLLLQEDIKIVGSGRTDAGVHCRQQFFHMDIKKEFDLKWLHHRINNFLPLDISIRDLFKVEPKAHARFDALRRSYEYHIVRNKDPFETEFSFFTLKELDVPTMNEAASLLVGKYNFESFSKVKTDVSNFVCEVTQAMWKEEGEKLIFYISANRFLRGMVRAIVGTLLDVGEHKISLKDFEEIINARDRKRAGAASAAHGLYLVEVQYPDHIYLNRK